MMTFAGRRYFIQRVLLAAWLCLISTSLWADYGVQIGVYRKAVYADETARILRETGFPVDIQHLNTADGREMIRLVVGLYPKRRDAVEAMARLKTLGYDGFIRKFSSGLSAQQQPTQEAPPPLPAAPVVTNGVQGEGTGLTQEGQFGVISPSPEDTPVTDGGSALDIGTKADTSPSRFTGFFQSELAYTSPKPGHLSKFRHTLELTGQGRLGEESSWKVSGRTAYDAVFDLNNFYSRNVEEDQRWQTTLRETYIDVPAGNWDFRIGRQHIVWGEMIGLYVADVVSAKDMRDFVLPEFDMMRIPQWAMRGEYFQGNFHGEIIWIIYPGYDEIGTPGSDFYSYPTPPPSGYRMIINGEHKSAGSLTDSGYGVMASYIVEGWDLSAFYYSSMDSSPTFFREVVTTPQPAFVFRPDHDRIQQIGGTLSKDFEATVLKAEMVYTPDRWYEVRNLSDVDGVVRTDALDYVVGLEYSLPEEGRLNFQFFQRWFPNHNSTMTAERTESGASVYVSTKLLDGKLEPQLLVMGGLNRGDWMARPKLVWSLGGQWRWVTGVDVFGGLRNGLFGRYDDNDRVYTELRYTF